jgi:hypothetical protein
MNEAPGYWMNETGGVLQPAVRAYLAGEQLNETQIAAIRAYLRQWVMAPAFEGGEDLEALRQRVDGLNSRAAIAAWLAAADELGIDPL